MRPPAFWRARGWRAQALRPVGALYAAAGALRRRMRRPTRATIPVICVGNPTLGGAGKTPLVHLILARLQAMGARPAVLLRGYGGRLSGPLLVDPARHGPTDVGDEALLHAARAPTVVSADRPAGARLAAESGCDVLVMDDGFQNPTLAKDLSLLVIDGAAGVGNGLVAPAGPLREPLPDALARADLVVMLGADGAGLAPSLEGGPPILRAQLDPIEPLQEALSSPLVAFAGIGRPEKFYRTLEQAGATLVGRRSFPDHHNYSEYELEALRREADKAGARLVTTEKDHVRLSPSQRRALETRIGPLSVLKVALVIPAEDEGVLSRRLEAVLHR